MKKFLTVLAVIVVLVIIGAGLLQWQRSTQQPGGGEGPRGDIGREQPEWCPRVEVIAAPGTWESAPDDDPIHPQANPNSFMLSITQPLQETYPENDVKVWTLPYTAQFRNINAQQEMSYDDSRQEGTATLENELRTMHEQCPATQYILSGFSQGAVIVGDIANRIGNGVGVVPADRVLGVAVIADGRREPGVGVSPGVEIGGVGAEVALHPVSALVQPVVPGATMRGPREGGYGELQDRAFDLCAPNDSICDAPRDLGNAMARAQALVQANGVHAQYASNPDVVPGTTANQWVVDWAKGVIDGA